MFKLLAFESVLLLVLLMVLMKEILKAQLMAVGLDQLMVVGLVLMKGSPRAILKDVGLVLMKE